MPKSDAMQTKTDQALSQADKELKKTLFGMSLCGLSMKGLNRSPCATCLLVGLVLSLGLLLDVPTAAKGLRPNILFCISDDQSYAHTGANGDPVIKTPAFDRVAREGLRFVHAFCDAPTCGPSRSAILTGQHIWRLEEAGNIHSTLPAKFSTYTEELGKAGYAVGFTGKGWSPGRLQAGGRTVNPACLLYTSPSPRDKRQSRMPSSA